MTVLEAKEKRDGLSLKKMPRVRSMKKSDMLKKGTIIRTRYLYHGVFSPTNSNHVMPSQDGLKK